MVANRPDVALIGYQDQGNLGMGYLAAVLHRHGHSTEIIDVRDDPGAIAARLVDRPPLIVGFSLIFQAFLPQFRRVASHLRESGIRSHFTIGGHFPSLCHDEVLAHFPELDSVVRYEGEETLLELVDRLAANRDWRDVAGVAYLRDGEVICTPARALIADLERYRGVRVFLFQDDDFPLWRGVGRRWAAELASRLHESGLAERTIWKISWRGEDVEPQLFAMLRDAGLLLVYRGNGSGVDSGLEILYKQI